MKAYRLTFADLAFAVLMWMLLVLRYGYTFGTNDHIELLPYVLFLKNHLLFPHDLFIQSLNASQPNERTVMANLLLPFVYHLGPAVFLLHCVNTILLLLALIKLAGRFICNKYAVWLAVYASVLLLNDKGLGNVDLYTPSIQASDVSCMMIAWALNVFLDRRYVLASVLMSAATFIHVLEGFDVMALLCAVMLVRCFWDKAVGWRKVVSFIGIYLMTAGVYLLFIYRAKTSGGAAMPQEGLFQIMFAFRHPHHFIFSTFPLFNKMLFAVCITVSLFFFSAGRSRELFLFVALGALGVLVYILCVNAHIVFIANFQWYKVVQWTKFMGIVAICGMLFNSVRSYMADQSRPANNIMVVLGVLAGCSMFQLYRNGEFEEGYKQGNADEIHLCKKLRQITPQDAVFVQPFEMTALKFYGLRSSYVEFKAIAKNQKDLKVWYERIQEVYGLDYTIDRNGFNMQWKADDHLDNLNDVQLNKLKKEGVTHLICHTAAYEKGRKLILAEKDNYVYQL